MPKKTMDYSKGLIYTITTDDGVYVGSTTNFTKRKCSHKTKMSNETDKAYNFKLYKAMRASSSYEIKPYKLFPCNSNLELVIEEERVRKELNANLNMIACYDDGTRQRETQKIYRETHKDEIAEKGKEKHTCEICGSIYRKGHKSRHTKSNKCHKALAKTTTLQ